MLEAAKDDTKLEKAMIEAATDADAELVTPLLQFRNYGQQLPNNRSTISNEAVTDDRPAV